MSKTLEFFFDYVSPWSYIAWVQLDTLKARTGCHIAMRPMFLGGVMQATGNRPPATVEAKGRHMWQDLSRCSRKLGVPFAPNRDFPLNTLPVLRMTAGMEEADDLTDFVSLCFYNMWVEPKNISDLAVLRDVFGAAGLDADALFAMSQDEANKARIKENTDVAIGRGAFGAPTFFVGENMYFGQDRFDLIEDALTECRWV